MHEQLLAYAAAPRPAMVLGLLLRPYSIGHEVLLVREGNPLGIGAKMEDGRWKMEEARRQDLEEAVLICCESFEGNKRLDLFLGWKRRLWRWRTGKLSFGRELAGFLEYQGSGSLEFPISDHWRPAGEMLPEPRPPGAPFLLRLQQFLVTRLGLSEVAAWDYPLGLAKMHWAAYWEEEGGLGVANKHDQAHAEFVARMEEEEENSLPAHSGRREGREGEKTAEHAKHAEKEPVLPRDAGRDGTPSRGGES